MLIVSEIRLLNIMLDVGLISDVFNEASVDWYKFLESFLIVIFDKSSHFGVVSLNDFLKIFLLLSSFH
jgi:hypothetical protein